MLGDMFLWLVANLKQGVIYFIKQALPPNISAGSVLGMPIVKANDPIELHIYKFMLSGFRTGETSARGTLGNLGTDINKTLFLK